MRPAAPRRPHATAAAEPEELRRSRDGGVPLAARAIADNRVVFIRQLEYLTALARERHFGRAAAACHVSQPSLSAAIRKLEQELGVPLVHRDRRYDALTPEGEAVLRWAQRALDDIGGLSAEASGWREQLTSTLRLGVIPTALPTVSLITGPLLDRHLGVSVEVVSLSSLEIERRLASRELDAGLTYLDNEPLGEVDIAPLYRERYLYLTAEDEPAGDRISWAELAGRPLCLLTPDMQSRRIVDSALAHAGVQVQPRVEANSISALLSFASVGRACVISHAWLALRGALDGMRSLRLVEPEVAHTIGLITPKSDLDQPVVRALKQTLVGLDVEHALALASA